MHELQESIDLRSDSFEVGTESHDAPRSSREARKVRAALGTIVSEGRHDGNPMVAIPDSHREPLLIPQADSTQFHGRFLLSSEAPRMGPAAKRAAAGSTTTES